MRWPSWPLWLDRSRELDLRPVHLLAELLGHRSSGSLKVARRIVPGVKTLGAVTFRLCRIEDILLLTIAPDRIARRLPKSPSNCWAPVLGPRLNYPSGEWPWGGGTQYVPERNTQIAYCAASR